MVFVISHVSAAGRPPGSPPLCFSSISPPERWFQIEKMSPMCVSHAVLAILRFVNVHAHKKIMFPLCFATSQIYSAPLEGGWGVNLILNPKSFFFGWVVGTGIRCPNALKAFPPDAFNL